MTHLNEIRECLAATAPNFQSPIPGFPASEPAWVMRVDAQSSGVFFPLTDHQNKLVVFEEFANVRLQTIEHHVNGILTNCLALHCLDHSQREKFSLVCDDFLNPSRRNYISRYPSRWWGEWSNLLGNSNTDQSPHAILGELVVWRHLHRIKKKMNWSGPDASTHDLVGNSFDIEVKSTIKRYGKKVLISGEHQLAIAEGKSLYLAFMRFELSEGGESINSLTAELIALGANATDIEKDLSGMGYQSGKSTRAETYMLHDSEIYEVTNLFPKIIPSSFMTGIIPTGIEQIKYEVDLSIVTAFSTLDDFNP